MGMYGRARTSRSHPQAHAICDRCGRRVNHVDLRWQFDWRGTKLQNLRILVCDSCLDVPQEGLRVFSLPADPVPIDNPRPEAYSIDNNPISTIGSPFGSMTSGAGLAAIIDSNTNKISTFSALSLVSAAGYNNTAGVQFSTQITLARFKMYAPIDAPFLASGSCAYKIQGANTAGVFSDIYSASTVGGKAEVIDITLSSPVSYYYYQANIFGDGSQAALAQLVIYES